MRQKCRMSQFLTLPQVAKIAGIDRRHALRLAASGQIPGAVRRPSGHWRVEDSDALRNWTAGRAMVKIHRMALGPDNGLKVADLAAKLRVAISNLFRTVNPAGGGEPIYVPRRGRSGILSELALAELRQCMALANAVLDGKAAWEEHKVVGQRPGE